MRVAVVGSGISGLVASYLLQSRHQLTLFEAEQRIGGHTHTHQVQTDEGKYAVDSGFIVFNEQNYPLFTGLLERLGVASQPSDMSFSVRCDRSGLEYNAGSAAGFFAQRRNLLSPSFLWMLREILRFRREVAGLLRSPDDSLTLGDYLRRGRYSRRFVEQFLLPLGAAIWSAEPERMRDFPLHTLVRFFSNHRFLEPATRPQWRVVKGGSQRYVDALTRGFRDRIRLGCPVGAIRRLHDGVELRTAEHAPERFDAVVLATHSDQALALLSDASDQERKLLSAIRYQQNDTVLHTDASLLPRCRRAWGSWNYRIPRDPRQRLAISYYMNRLQSLAGRTHFCVTLNDERSIEQARVVERMRYHHPVFEPAAVAAQARHGEINGHRSTYYCGAYWGYGFHEDGVRSAVQALTPLGLTL